MSSSPPLSFSFAGPTYDSDIAVNKQPDIPPDPSAAVGLDFVVTATNGSINWYTRDGTLQHAASLGGFFGQPAGTTMGDPRVVYDALSGRFVIAVITGSGPSSQLLLAVSNDANPNDGFTMSSRALAGLDFTCLATNGTTTFVAFNDFSGTTFNGNFLFALPETGGSFSVVSDGSHTIHPAMMLSAPQSGIGTFAVAYDAVHQGADKLVTVTPIDSSGNPQTAQRIDVGSIDSSNNKELSVAQPQGAMAIDANDSRISYAAWRNNFLYVVANVVPTSGPDAGLPTVHWWKFDTSNPSNIVLVDQGNVDGSAIAPGTATFDGSIAVDANNDFAVNFSASGPNLLPGSYYSVHAAGDAAGTLEAPVALAAGQSTYVRTFGSGENRWGDNSSVAVDPRDNSTFWAFNQFAETPGDLDRNGETGRWGTAVGAFNVGGTPVPFDGPFTASWNIAALGSFDGTDGGLAWRRSSDGLLAIQSLSGIATASAGFVTNNPFDASWTIAASGDFLGNGKTDLLWRRASDGLAEIQFLNGAQSAGGGVIADNPFDASWTIAATGDFNGDGKTDLVWRRASDGLTEIQFLNGDAGAGGGVIAGSPFDANWDIVASGDFLGNGKDDLVWRRKSDGLTEVQLLNGNTGVGGGVIANSPFDANWNLVASGDFNGDGRSDLVWRRKSDGLTEIQFLNGNTGVGGGMVTNNPFDASWSIVGTGDFLGNGKDGLVWRRASDGLTEVQFLDGSTATGGGLVEGQAAPGFGVSSQSPQFAHLAQAMAAFPPGGAAASTGGSSPTPSDQTDQPLLAAAVQH